MKCSPYHCKTEEEALTRRKKEALEDYPGYEVVETAAKMCLCRQGYYGYWILVRVKE